MDGRCELVTDTLTYSDFGSLRTGQEFRTDDHGRPNDDVWIKINPTQAIYANSRFKLETFNSHMSVIIINENTT